MKKITNLTEAFDSLNKIKESKRIKEDLNPNTIHDYIDEFVSMEDLGLMALKWLSSSELVDMLEAYGYEDVDEFEESLKDNSKKRSLNEDFIISPEKEYTSKSGHKILIKDVIPYVSEYDGTAHLEIKYDYKLNGSDEWKSSKCNQYDLFKMLTESSKNESLNESRWSYTLKSGSELRSAINDEDPMGVIFALQNAYAELRDAGIIDEDDFDSYTGDFEMYEEDDDDIEETADYELDNFYDLCDALKVWIPLD